MKGIIIIAGTTGAGKTTHAKILAEKTGATYISSGDIARNMMDAQTDTKFRDGRLSPHEDRIRTEIYRKIEGSEVCILDGFPRVRDQYEWLCRSVAAALFVIRLDWPTKVLVNRWVERMRDDYDTLTTYVKRDELYRKETLPLFPKPDFVTNHEFEQETIDINNTIRGRILVWLAGSVPTFRCKDSPRAIAIDRFIKEHHITYWHPDRTRTYGMLDQDIEKELWRIVNA